MKRYLLTFVLTFVLFAPASAQVRPDATQRAALDAFTARHGTSWHIRWNERTGTPASVFWGKTLPFKGTPLEAARAFLRENRELFKMKPGLSDLTHVRTQAHRGIHHVKFQQTYQGLPVEGAEHLVHIHEDGGVDMANGTYYPAVQAPTRPALTEAAALRIAEADLGADVTVQDEVASDLVVYPAEDRFHLAWKLRLSRQTPPDAWIYYVDALSGAVLHRRSDYREVAMLGDGARLVLEPTPTRLEPFAFTAPSMATGQGYVYATHPGLNASTVTRSLPRLDGSGYLRGTYVTVTNLESAEAFNASNQFFYTPSSTHFDEVNVYYHLDRFRNDYINTLGSLSLGQITARVHLKEANAGFNAPSTLDFGDSIDLFGDPIPCCNNFAHEDKIIYHEYMHAVSYALSSISGGGTGETGAVDEGLSDYFAGSFTGRTKILDYAWPSDERDMANPGIAHYSQYLDLPSVPRHDGGEFFSAILWDLRSDIGQPDADFMTFSALYRITSQPDFIDYREAMLADAFLVGNAEACAVASAFANRGLGDPLLVNITGPYTLAKSQQGTWTAQTPCTTGSHTYAWRYRFNGTGSWSGVVSTSQTYSATMGTTDIELKVTVTQSGQTAEDTHYVDYCTSCSGGGAKRDDPVVEEVPAIYVLESNYPNPFNPTTEIRLQLPEAVEVSLVVYDVLGREVARLVEGRLEAGYHRQAWDASRFPSGVYVYRLQTGSFVASRHMILLK